MAGIDHDNPPYTKNKDWVYQIDGSEAVIHRYRGHREELFFPAEIEGKRVNGIADRFGKEDDSYTRIKRIVLPEGYRYIGAYAFAGCKSLREAVLPSTVRVIGDGAFLKCAKLREITLPDSLAEIYHDYDDKSGGRFMFKGCTSLKIASIPEELSYYDGHPFEECTKVCMRLNDCKPSLIRMCVIDHRDKEMEAVSTDHIYAGAKLIIHHNEQENRIELLSSLTQYAGYIVKEEEFDFVPVTEFKEYPDHKQIRIISVSKCYFDNCVSEVEFVLE